MICPHCGYAMDAFDKECPRCHGKGIAKPVPSTPSTPSPQSTAVTPPSPAPAADVVFSSDAGGMNGLQIIGGLLLGLGLICAAYFFLFFDTSVAVPTTTIFGTEVGGGRVNNIGLMAQRQNGILLGIGLAVVGAVLFGVGQSQANAAPALAPSNAAPLKSSDNDIRALFFISFLLPIGGFVLCLINMNRPERAKAAAIGTAAGIIVGLLVFGRQFF